MADCKVAPTPFVSSQKLLTTASDVLSDPTSYRSLVGALQYATFTRPYITFAVNHVCQFMHAPTSLHLIAAKRILCYLKGSINLGILFQPGPLQLTAFTDADWAGDPNDRRSTTSIAIFLSHNPITWLSKKQHTVSRLQLRLSTALSLLGLQSLLGFFKCSVIWVYFFLRPLSFGVITLVLLL